MIQIKCSRLVVLWKRVEEDHNKQAWCYNKCLHVHLYMYLWRAISNNPHDFYQIFSYGIPNIIIIIIIIDTIINDKNK